MKRSGGFIIVLVLMLAGILWFYGKYPDRTDETTQLRSLPIAEGISDVSEDFAEADIPKDCPETNIPAKEDDIDSFGMEEVPPFTFFPSAEIHQNIPYFSEEELTEARQSYERYADLDELGRCGVCMASIGKDLMPTQEREPIGMIKPSGWHTVKYNDLIEGNYLYNRCHLIGYQLSGENANVCNLITGTRYLNIDGMLPYERKVADYVREKENHVLYRSTPVFEGDNPVATGVLMEARSVEDGGEGLMFCVFAYNVQPGVEIDYATGESRIVDADLTQYRGTSVKRDLGQENETLEIGERKGEY